MAAVEQIAQIRAAHARAEGAGSFDQVVEFVADDLIVAPPGNAPIEGRDEWASRFDKAMADAPDREYEITYTSHETLVSGDLAIDRGTCTDTAKDDSGELAETEYNYLMVFRHTDDGSWKQIRTIWNKIG